MGALREVFARFAFAFDGRDKLASADKGVDKLAKKAKDADQTFGQMAAGFAAAFAGNAILGGINHFAEQLDTLDDLSAQTGVATDSLQVYGYAAQKSGASVEEFNGSLSLLQKNLGKTGEATGAQVDALKALKIDTSTPRELADVLPEIFDGFAKLPNASKKAEVATALFGRAGVRLIPTLERGTAGMAELRAELEESGGIVSSDTIAKAGEYRDNLARLDRSVFALKGTLAGALFPQLSKVVETMSKGVGGVVAFAKGTTLAENASLALAASLAGPVLGALRPFLGRGLKFAAVFAAVDDLVGFLNGKDSLIGDILDGAFGDGTATTVRRWTNDAIEQIAFLTSSFENSMAVIEDTHAGTFDRMIAATTIFFRDMFSGFPVLRAGMAQQWAIAVDDFDQAVLALERRWNLFVQGLHLPDVITTALQVDTTDARRRVRDSENARDEASTAVSAKKYGRTLEEQKAHEAQGDFGSPLANRPDRTGLTATGRAAFASPEGVDASGLGAGRRETRGERIDREREDAQAQVEGLAPKAVLGTLTDARGGGTTATLNDNKTVNLNFAKGVGAADRDAIKAAVAEALRTNNQAALEALTQKAPGK